MTTRLDALATLMRRHQLGGMAERLLLQEAERDQRPFLDRLAEMVESEAAARGGRGYARRARDARLPLPAELDQVSCSPERNLSRRDLALFRTAEWVRLTQHLVIVGKSGRGTTHLACAIADVVLRAGLRVRYEEVPGLIAGWHAACDQRCDDDYVRSIQRNDLLVLDDFGNNDEALDLEDVRALRRCLRPMLDRRSLLVVSKNKPEDLGEWLGGRETADELVDRLSCAHRLELAGPSFRVRPHAPTRPRGSSRTAR